MSSLSFKSFLLEARRNPDHPEQENLICTNIFKKYMNLPQQEIDKLFVSFTNLDKIGINPQSKYDTPNGIYTYPLSYVLEHDTPANLPFAGENKHVWVISPNVSVLNLYKYDNLDTDKKKAYDYLINSGMSVQSANKLINHAIENARRNENQDASRMWNIARMIAKNTSETHKISVSDQENVKFNVILRKVFGYSVIYDPGLGIIHPNEPHQCLFLSKSSFNIVDKLINKPHNKDKNVYKNIVDALKDKTKIVIITRFRPFVADISNLNISSCSLDDKTITYNTLNPDPESTIKISVLYMLYLVRSVDADRIQRKKLTPLLYQNNTINKQFDAVLPKLLQFYNNPKNDIYRKFESFENYVDTSIKYENDITFGDVFDAFDKQDRHKWIQDKVKKLT